MGEYDCSETKLNCYVHFVIVNLEKLLGYNWHAIGNSVCTFEQIYVIERRYDMLPHDEVFQCICGPLYVGVWFEALLVLYMFRVRVVSKYRNISKSNQTTNIIGSLHQWVRRAICCTSVSHKHPITITIKPTLPCKGFCKTITLSTISEEGHSFSS